MPKSIFQVKKRKLLAIAGSIWILAGLNVAKIGFENYLLIKNLPFFYPILSLLIFSAFATLFYKLSAKHHKRIKSYHEDTRPFWHFFDLKSYLIMIFMISGGSLLRISSLAPIDFIAVFYAGIGLALISAGISFWQKFFKY